MAGKPKENSNTIVLTKVNVRKARRFKVILFNDDHTTFDFVIDLLVSLFGKTHEEGEAIAMQIHRDGKGIAGIYSREVAETKVMEVHMAARNAGFPLKAAAEPE